MDKEDPLGKINNQPKEGNQKERKGYDRRKEVAIEAAALKTQHKPPLSKQPVSGNNQDYSPD